MQQSFNKKQSCDTTRPYCFISYSSADSYCVHSFVQRLIDEGFNVWIDWELNNHVGTKWDEIAYNAIFNANCKCIFWFVSSASCTSANVAGELEHSQEDATLYNHRKVPVKIYPLEVQEIKPNNDITAFLDALYANADENAGNTIARIQKIISDNKIKRLSIEKAFTPEGIDNIVSSLKNDGWADIVKNPILQRFDDYRARIMAKSCSQQVLDTITPELLPTLQRDGECLKTDDLIDLICRSVNTGNRRIALKGNGGTGKTTLLLHILEKLIESNVPAVYIPLKELDQSQSIYDYVKRQLVPETTSCPQYIVELVENHTMIYLLDGLNEVTSKNERFVKEQIDIIKQNNHIVITSRNDYKTGVKYKSVYDDCTQYEITPLTETTINEYILKHDLESVDGRVLKLLSSPLMLRLYVEQELFKNNHNIVDVKPLWKEEKNEGNLIWNYLLFESAKTVANSNNEKDDVLFTLLYLAPYIAWYMIKHNTLSIKDRACNVALTHFKKLYLGVHEEMESLDGMGGNAFISTIPFPFDFADGGTCIPKLFETLLNSGILCKQDQEYFFCHQMFRDCLAAIHCINSIGISFDEDVAALSEKALSEDVLQFMIELDSEHRVDSYWRLLDRSFFPEKKSMTRINLIRLFDLRNLHSLSAVDFSGKDLRNISLNSFMLSSGNKGARFCRAKLSEATFSSPATHFSTITAITLTDDFRYIISGDCNGIVVVYDTELSQAIMNRKYFPSHNVAVKKLMINESYLYICYANGYTVAVDINFEEDPEPRVLTSDQNDVLVDADIICDELYLAFPHRILKGDSARFPDTAAGYSEVQTFEAFELKCIACSEESERIFCGFSDGRIAILDLLHDELDSDWLVLNEPVKSLVCDEFALYGVTGEGKVLKWDIDSAQPALNWTWDTSNAGEASIIRLSGKGDYLFSASNEGDLIRVDTRNGKIQHSYQSGAQREPIHTLCLSSDDAYLITDSLGNTPVMRDVKNTENSFKTFSSETSGPIYAINVSKNGKYAIAQNSTNYGIEYAVWDLEKEMLCYVPITLSSVWGNAKSISDNGRMLYLGQGEQFYFFDLEKKLSEQVTKPADVYDGWMYALLIDDDTDTVFMGVDNNRIYLIDSNTGAYRAVSHEFESTVNCFYSDASSGYIYAGDRTGKIHRLDKQGNSVYTYSLDVFSDWVNDICTADDGNTIYAGLDNGYVIRIDANTGKTDPVWRQQPKRRWDKPCIRYVTVDKETDCIIAVSGDCDVYMIDQQEQRMTKTTNFKTRYSGEIEICSFAQIENSSYVLVGDKKGDMHLYDATSDTMIKDYHRIPNAFIVGCDFAKVDCGEDEHMLKDLKSSGGKV